MAVRSAVGTIFVLLRSPCFARTYKASRVASARVKPFAYDRFRQERVQTKKPELRIAGAKPFCKAIEEFVEEKLRKW